MVSTPTRRSVIGAEGDTPDVRVRRMAEVATAQARVIGRKVVAQRFWRRVSIVAGSVMGVAGLVASVLVAFSTGTVTPFWWILVPTWILTAAALLALTRHGDDKLPSLGARSTSTAELALRLSRTIDAGPVDDRSALVAELEPLTDLVEQELRATSRLLSSRRVGGARRRRHRRIVPRERRVIVSTVDGRRLRATIADVSLSGVAMTAPLPRLSDGESVVIGRTWASVARQWDGGIAFRFEMELDASTFDEEVIL